MKFDKLTPEEEQIIVNKGTEPPFSGKYDDFFQDGIYVCRRCNTPLYRSESKFDAHCGWPSFDDEIPGAVSRQLDTDGIRTEITCNTCGGHLGHVFFGEKLTPKNTRHCVNSLSMRFIPKQNAATKEIAVFGASCFWAVETIFKRLIGVISVIPGYAGGISQNPTYQEVSGGATNHAEVVKIEFDPTNISYAALLEIFFNIIHNQITLSQQNKVLNNQYRSVILYASDQQKEAAQRLANKLKTQIMSDRPIATEIKPFVKFFPAENHHQDYYEKNKNQPYCQFVIEPKIKSLEQQFSQWLK